MSKHINFGKQFWKDKRTIGSLMPSSPFLRTKILKNIDFTKDQIFIELGPGMGVFTREIVAQMSANSILLVFEVNDLFYKHIVADIKDKRIHIIHDSAEKINEYLQKLNLDNPDVIISSLPLAAFNSSFRKMIISQIHNSLKQTGTFIQFQYSLQAKYMLKKLYKKVNISFTILNFPPAFIYYCKKDVQNN